MNNKIETYFDEKLLDRLMHLPEIIEAGHKPNIKMLEIINNDTYNNMNAVGLFNYEYIEKGHSAAKGVLNKPSQMNLVFYFYLNIILDLKAFGLNKNRLHKVKDYLFSDVSILDALIEPDLSTISLTESLTNLINESDFEDSQIKETLLGKINSGKFINDLENKNVSLLFLNIFKLISKSHDIYLLIDVNIDAMFIDEMELNNKDIIDLTKDSRIIIPLKQYLVKFIGKYCEHNFISKAKILSEKDIMILEQLNKSDIDSITVEFHNGMPNTMEIKKQKKIEIQSRLSDILLKSGFEDIILKTKHGSIYYSQLTTKTKL